MGFESLKNALSANLRGVGADRIAVRTQGCWSCVHASYEKAADLWWKEARLKLLERGVQVATTSPQGEKDPRVLAIRRNVPLMDASMTAHEWVSCPVGKNPSGDPVATFIAATYLCDRWSGATGASVAREGKSPDKLPEELFQRFNDDGKIDD